MIRKIIKALWIFLAVIVLAIVIVFVSISKGWIGYFASIDYIKKFIDVLAAHKMNTFHWHLTDDKSISQEQR